MTAAPFAQIPDGLTFDRNLSLHAKFVYQVLKARTNRSSGRCDPKLDKIAEWTGLSKRMVERCLRQLRLAGWVDIRRRGSCSNQYACQDEPLPQRQSATGGGLDPPVIGGLSQLYLFTEPDVLNQRRERRSARVRSSAAAAAGTPTPTQPNLQPSSVPRKDVGREEGAIPMVRASLAALAQEVHMPPPDEDLIRRVVAAAPGASGTQIHATLAELWKRGRLTGMRSWGLLPIVIGNCYRAQDTG